MPIDLILAPVRTTGGMEVEVESKQALSMTVSVGLRSLAMAVASTPTLASLGFQLSE